MYVFNFKKCRLSISPANAPTEIDFRVYRDPIVESGRQHPSITTLLLHVAVDLVSAVILKGQRAARKQELKAHSLAAEQDCLL